MNESTSMNRNAVDAYRSGAILNSPRLKLVRMVYAGAVKEIKRALAEYQNKNRAAYGIALGRAQALIGELMSSLDHEQGSEVSRSLESLYEFCMWNITQANIQFTTGPLDATLGVLTRLQEAWEQIEDAEDPDA